MLYGGIVQVLRNIILESRETVICCPGKNTDGAGISDGIKEETSTYLIVEEIDSGIV
jgi:hypothetical protein